MTREEFRVLVEEKGPVILDGRNRFLFEKDGNAGRCQHRAVGL